MTTTMSTLDELLPGYEVGGELGRGGMGVVRSGVHHQLGRKVAIKQLPPVLADKADVRARFVAEARVLASLDHPHIVPVYDYVERDGVCALVMEQLPGGTVWSLFTERGLEPPAACATVMVTCAGLHYAHDAGILHRDVKPENLMFSGSGQLKVTDFGIAKVVGGGDALATAAGDILGTPAYMAPEQAEGRELGPAADVYATGVMLYELLSGRLPFAEDGGALAIIYRHVYEDPIPILDIAPHVPAPLADVAMRALARTPGDRYPTAEAFGVAVGEAATAFWGPGWMQHAHISLMAPGPILASAERPTLEQDRPPEDAPADRDVDPRSTLPGTSATPPPTPPPAGPGGAASPPSDGRAAPTARRESATVNVRPVVAEHVGGAPAADLAPDDLLTVSDVLQPPSRPVVPALAVVLLIAATIALAFAGVGTPDRDGVFGPGQASVAGVDVTSDDPAVVDFAESIPVRVDGGAPAARGAEEIRLGFSVAGIPLIGSSAEPFAPDTEIELEANANRFLAAGVVQGELELLDGEGSVIATHELGVEREGSSFPTLPGIATVAATLVLLAYAESVLRPLRRRARRRVTGTVALMIVGAGLGVVAFSYAWLLKATEVTVPGAAVCAGAGAAAGLVAALTAIQIGRRARVMRALNSRELQKLFARAS